ncbi:MAG: DUF126 domain-containing protein [Sulfolobales archaeon]
MSFLGDLDVDRGYLVGYGSVSNKLLVFPGSSGSTVGPYVIYSLAKKSLAPAAMIVKNPDTLLITGCVLSNIPMVIASDWVGLAETLKECTRARCYGKLLSSEGVLIVE